MTPWRLTRPRVVRNPVTPQRLDGPMIEPAVSVPIENPTQPAAVAEAGPAEDPPDPCEGSHGFFVCPPNHLSPAASSPETSFAIRTAPASRSISMTLASSSITWSFQTGEPHVVG